MEVAAETTTLQRKGRNMKRIRDFYLDKRITSNGRHGTVESVEMMAGVMLGCQMDDGNLAILKLSEIDLALPATDPQQA